MRSTFAAGLGIVILAICVYLPGLSGGPILDDASNFEPLGDYLKGKLSLTEVIQQNSSGPGGRPISILSFAANYATSGDLLWPLKATNLAIHIICGIVIYLLGAALFECVSVTAPRARLCAGIVASLWLFSPLFVSTVLYIVQRMAQLSALFCLLGLLCYVYGRRKLEMSPRLAWAMVAGAFLVCLPLAVLSKENGAVLPLLLLLVEVCFFRFEGSKRLSRNLRLIFGITVGVPFLAGLLVTAAHPGIILDGYRSRDFSLYERLLTEARVLWGYAYDLFLPRVTSMGVFHDDYAISRSLFDPATTLFACAGWLILIAVASRRLRTTSASLWFGPIFFLAAHTIESTVLPLEPVFEHRNYLPAFGVYFGVVLLGARAWDTWPTSRRALGALAVMTPLLFAAGTIQRSMLWSDIGAMLRAAEQAHPNSPRLHAELAGLAMDNDELDSALAHLDRVAALRPDYAVAVALHKELAFCVTAPDSQIWPIESAGNHLLLPNHPYTLGVMSALAAVHEEGRCGTRSIRPIALRLKELYARSHMGGGWLFNFTLGRILVMAGDLPGAFAFWSSADELDPARLETGLMRVRILMDLGEWHAAAQVLDDVKRRDQGRIRRHSEAIAQYGEEIATMLAEKRD
jgi:tetratricopeptide (TPR) repeat protein